jgi:hypothetical protein
VHRLVEDEFFSLESSSRRGKFAAKAHTCRFYFNLVRANSHKANQILWQITITWIAHRSALELCLRPPVSFDSLFNDSGGYDLRDPYRASRSPR